MNLESTYLSRNDYLKAAECQLSLIKISIKKGNKKAALHKLNELLAVLEKAPDSAQLASISSQAADLFEKELSSNHGVSYSVSARLLKQMLSSQYHEKLELFHRFEFTLGPCLDNPGLSTDDLHCLQEIAVLFLKGVRAQLFDLSADSLGNLNDLLWERHLIKEARELLELRIAVSGITGEPNLKLKTRLASSLVRAGLNDESTVATLHDLRNDKDAECKDIISSFDTEYGVYFSRNDFKSALKCSQEALKYLEDRSNDLDQCRFMDKALRWNATVCYESIAALNLCKQDKELNRLLNYLRQLASKSPSINDTFVQMSGLNSVEVFPASSRKLIEQLLLSARKNRTS